MEKNIPNLRFPEFTGEWEEKKLGEIASFSKGKGISKADISDNGTTECIRYGELYTTYGETIIDVKSKTSEFRSVMWPIYTRQKTEFKSQLDLFWPIYTNIEGEDMEGISVFPFYTYNNGRVYYKASEVEQFMQKKGKTQTGGAS